MKISLLMAKSVREITFSEKAISVLSSLGELTFNQTESTDIETVKKTIKNADIAITAGGNTNLVKEILDEAPELKLVVHAAGTIKPIVSDEIWKRNIRITSSPKALGMGVAETALGFTISASKNFYNLSKNTASGGWYEGREKIIDLFDITIGVIGAGWAGKHYISLIKNFDVDVIVYDPYLSQEKIQSLGARKVELDELLKTSDIVSIHAPSIKETYKMINEHTLSLMKKDAVLINTARGSLIDENALYNHMKAGNLKYACLDVTDPEPPAVNNPLRSLPNVILTPHLAGLVNYGKRKIGIHVCEEIKKYLEDRPMDCEVTEKMLATMA